MKLFSQVRHQFQLLASYIFNDLKYRRLEWRSADENHASKRSAVRLGFTYEGTFRQHMVIRGNMSLDNCYFSIIDKEWPVVGVAMKKWLKEGNFDGEGNQRKRLEEIRKEMQR